MIGINITLSVIYSGVFSLIGDFTFILIIEFNDINFVHIFYILPFMSIIFCNIYCEFG